MDASNDVVQPDHGQAGTSFPNGRASQDGSSAPGESAQKAPLPEPKSFEKAIASWRSIDLGRLVQQLDQTAADIVEHQREGLVQRKDLAQKTKDFRRLEDAAKLTEYKSLLKAYQTFIDLITNHGKTTSSAFLQLYSTVSEAPDPYPLLEASADSLLVAEETLPNISAENEKLLTSVRTLTRELESAERSRDNERRLRQELEASREARAQEIEASWKAVLDEKRDNWAAREQALEEKAEHQERLLNELKANYEVSQRLDQSQDANESSTSTATNAELELVTSELDRTSRRLAEVEARNEQLRIDLAQNSSDQTPQINVEEDPAFARLQAENESLLRRADAAKIDREASLRKSDGRVRSLEHELQGLQRERAELRNKIDQWRDYPEVKRELEVFKTIEFSTGDDDETAPSEQSHFRRESSTTTHSGTPKKENLEQLLLARNKKLSNEMAMLRVAHQELQREIEHLQGTVSSTNTELEQARSLNATLETDLVTLQQEASNHFPSSARSISSRYPTSATHVPSPYANSRTLRSSPTSSIISGFDGVPRTPYESLDSLRANDAVGGGSGILPMVQAQRDRFKQKNSQLETELQKQFGIVSSLRQEVASLQRDNLNLYEKTRYVSTYQRTASVPVSSASASSFAPGPTGAAVIPMGGLDARGTSPPSSMDRYRSAYEANLSPFAAFRGREATRAYKRMSAPERAIFAATRLVLSSRTSRNLFAGYCVGLHVLVFLLLYWMQGAHAQHAGQLGDAAVAMTAAAAAGGRGANNAAGGGSGGGAGGRNANNAKDGAGHKDDLVEGRPT